MNRPEEPMTILHDYQHDILTSLAKRLKRPILHVLDDLLWNGLKVCNHHEEASDLYNTVLMKKLKKEYDYL